MNRPAPRQDSTTEGGGAGADLPAPSTAAAGGPDTVRRLPPAARPVVTFDRRFPDRDRLLPLLAVPVVLWFAVLPMASPGRALTIAGVLAAGPLLAAVGWLAARAPDALVVDPDGSVQVLGHRDGTRLRNAPGAAVSGRADRSVLLTDADGETVRLRAHVHDTVGLLPLLAERGWAVPDQPVVTRGTTPPDEVVWEASSLPRPLALDVARVVAAVFVPGVLVLLVTGRAPLAGLLALLLAGGLLALELWWHRRRRRIGTQRLAIGPVSIDVERADGDGAHLGPGRLLGLHVVGLLGSRLVEVEFVTATSVAATLVLPREEGTVLGDVLAVHGHSVQVTPEWPRPVLELVDRVVELLNS